MCRNDKEVMVEKIREQYTEKGVSKLDELKALDARAKRPAKVFGYVFGTIGALVMGAGMSLIMTDIGTTVGIDNCMNTGIVIGIAGMIIVITNYPLYKKLLKMRRKEYAEEIMKLSDEMISKNV